MTSEPILYINGDFVPLSKAHISVLDQGFLLGDGVFDVVSAWKGSLFRLEAHLDRLTKSLRAACLGQPLSRSEWEKIIIETLKRNNLRDASVRLIVTRGVSLDVVADPRNVNATIIIWAAPYVFLANEETRSKGIKLHLSSVRGFSSDSLDPKYKCLDRLSFQLAKVEALESGCDDVVWLSPDGYLAEGPASNIFLVSDKKLFTPRRDILEGITRLTFLEIAKRKGIPVFECDLSPVDAFSADEIFTCSTAGGALAVRQFAGRSIGDTTPGPITNSLDEAYWALRESGEYGTSF